MTLNSQFDINKVRLTDMGIVSAQISNNTDLIALEKGKYAYNYTFGFQFAANTEAQMIRVSFDCDTEVVDRSSQKIIDIKAKFEIAYFFKIDNLIELFGSGQPDFTPSGDLEIALCNIAYSTSRGIMFTRCQGTPFSVAIMPIFSDQQLRRLVLEGDKEKHVFTS